MDYRTLGNSGCAVSNLGLGTMTFGAQTAALDAASDPHPADYPYGELGVDQRSRSLGG
jgi:aryl-alcohol dehydrogenase-like predicted oxidoreductase